MFGPAQFDLVAVCPGVLLGLEQICFNLISYAISEDLKQFQSTMDGINCATFVITSMSSDSDSDLSDEQWKESLVCNPNAMESLVIDDMYVDSSSSSNTPKDEDQVEIDKENDDGIVQINGRFSDPINTDSDKSSSSSLSLNLEYYVSEDFDWGIIKRVEDKPLVYINNSTGDNQIVINAKHFAAVLTSTDEKEEIEIVKASWSSQGNLNKPVSIHCGDHLFIRFSEDEEKSLEGLLAIAMKYKASSKGTLDTYEKKSIMIVTAITVEG
jgi:hypothetical protein